MSKLSIKPSDIERLTEINPSEPREILVESGGDGTSVRLTLEAVTHKSKKRIALMGEAFRAGSSIKKDTLGFHRMNKHGKETIQSSVSCYDYQGMYDLITY